MEERVALRHRRGGVLRGAAQSAQAWWFRRWHPHAAPPCAPRRAVKPACASPVAAVTAHPRRPGVAEAIRRVLPGGGACGAGSGLAVFSVPRGVHTLPRNVGFPVVRRADADDGNARGTTRACRCTAEAI